jgi:hypothetical protein
MDGFQQEAYSHAPVVRPRAKSCHWNVEQAKADYQLATRWIFSRCAPTGDMKRHGNVSISLHPEQRSGWVGMVNDR